MKKLITALVLFGGAVAGAVACSGPASADPVVVVNQSNSSTSASSDCLPAAVAAQLPPWLLLGSVPTCP